MKKAKKYHFLFLFLLEFCTVNAQYISVDDTYTAQQLVQNVLLNSGCANVSNFSVSGGNFGSGAASYGYFTSGSSGFPLASGVVLSTCRAKSCEGPNASLLSETASGWGGDSDLNAALGISNTHNATVLEFDFVPNSNSVSFDYLFASEEYHGTSPCRYSDGFAFLLKENGTSNPYQNLAIIPGTSTPVKVTSVHPDIPGGCSAQNPNYFGMYNGTNAPINFNGETVVMTAQANVVAGHSYHIKLVIADETNPQYDSAIFLGSNSFSIGTTINLGSDMLIANNTALCPGQVISIVVPYNSTETYQWYKDNVALTGETSNTININSTGTYSLHVTPVGSSCYSTGSVRIEYAQNPTIANFNFVNCDDNNDGISIFNLTNAASSITLGDNSLQVIGFYTSYTDAQSKTNAISNPSNYSNTTGNIVYARVENANGCFAIATITLAVSNNNVAPVSILKCDDLTQDGKTIFDLNADITPLYSGLPTGAQIHYYATQNDAFAAVNQLPNSYTNTTPFSQTIYARIVNNTDCYSITTAVLTVDSFSGNFTTETITICPDETATLQAPLGNSYLWNTGATSQNITTTIAGNYIVTITSSNGCSLTKTFIVQNTTTPVIQNIEINDFQDANSATVFLNSSGNFLFSLDNIHYQTSPTFYNLQPKAYTIYIKSGSCPPISETFYVLNYPKFFTPNGDGNNDFWRIKNLQYFPKTTVTIFDRYGKLIYQFNETDAGWNGLYQNNQLPSDDYWFTIEFSSQKIVKGHFAMVR